MQNAYCICVLWHRISHFCSGTIDANTSIEFLQCNACAMLTAFFTQVSTSAVTCNCKLEYFLRTNVEYTCAGRLVCHRMWHSVKYSQQTSDDPYTLATVRACMTRLPSSAHHDKTSGQRNVESQVQYMLIHSNYADGIAAFSVAKTNHFPNEWKWMKLNERKSGISLDWIGSDRIGSGHQMYVNINAH